MRLATSHGLFIAHFVYPPMPPLDKWMAANGEPPHRSVEIYFHEGECATKNKPCETPNTNVAIVRCHPPDPFSRARGRYEALRKVIAKRPRALRKEIWKEYFIKVGLKHRRKAS